MLERLPQFIDYIRYTDAKKTIKGDLRLSDCNRLVEFLSPDISQKLEKSNTDSCTESCHVIHLEFDFGVDDFANRYVKGYITTKLLLTCQRCMQAMENPVEINLALAFIKNKKQEKEISGLYDSFYIENSEPIDFYALVEDEVILSLPLIAKHEDENCLSMVLDEKNKQIDDIDIAFADAEEEAKKKNPFAILQQLKTK
jgi:uncharacterized protein